MKTPPSLNRPKGGSPSRPRLFFPIRTLLAVLFAFFPVSRAWAYIGPGVGFTMLWVSGAFLLVLIAAVAGLLIWPLRSLGRWRKRRADPGRDPDADQANKKAEGKRRLD